MTLSFSTKFPKGKGTLSGKPTHFVEKVWAGLIHEPTFNFNTSHYEEYLDAHQSLFGCDFGYDEIMIDPKIHTIRKYKKLGRWKPGTKIHYKIWSGKPYCSPTFNFAPLVPCKQTEVLDIVHRSARSLIFINKKFCFDTDDPRMLQMAKNDGFETVDDFFQWFSDDLSDAEIIHWTPLTYYRDDLNTFKIHDGSKKYTELLIDKTE